MRTRSLHAHPIDLKIHLFVVIHWSGCSLVRWALRLAAWDCERGKSLLTIS